VGCVVTSGLGKKTEHVRKWRIRYRQRQRETESVRGLSSGGITKATFPDECTLREFCELARSLFNVLASTRHEIRGDLEKVKSSCLSLSLEDTLSYDHMCFETQCCLVFRSGSVSLAVRRPLEAVLVFGYSRQLLWWTCCKFAVSIAKLNTDINKSHIAH
jgi:hypothetical protein